MRPGKLFVLLLLLGMVLGLPARGTTERRVALVIGNSEYKNTAALSNPQNDAVDVAAALSRLGFEVILRTNVDKRGTDLALQQFARAVRNADAALFFYAGHGMQYDNQNYLMPVDAQLEDEISLHYEMTSLDEVRTALDGATGARIIVLDACRNNPLAERLARSITSKGRDFVSVRGLVPIQQTAGTAIAYATQPGEVAADGTARNSPFTSALLSHIAEPGLEIGSMFRRVTSDVKKATKGQQVPELSISLDADFYLNQSESDLQVWTRVRASTDPAPIREFLARFPASFYAEDAKSRLELIEQDMRQAQARADADRAKAEQQAAEARAAALQARIAQIEADKQRAAAAREAQEKAAEREAALAAELAKLRADREKTAADAARIKEAQDAAAQQAERERVAAEALALERQRRDELAKAQAKPATPEPNATTPSTVVAEAVPPALAAPSRTGTPAPASSTPPSPVNVAAVEPAAAEPGPKPSDAAGRIVMIKTELHRLGCYSGALDSDWASANTRRAVADLMRYASLSPLAVTPSDEFLQYLHGQPERLCPLVCATGEVARQGRCVAKSCPSGETLGPGGNCLRRTVRLNVPEVRPSARPHPALRVHRPVEASTHAAHCFTFNGAQYCE